jgi:hypothetical protein
MNGKPFTLPVMAVLVVMLVSLPINAGAQGKDTAPGQQPPVNSTDPSINGTGIVGETLTASPGDWGGASVDYSYQWQRCNSSGDGCSSVDGAVDSTYGLGSSDVGSTLRVVVTASNKNGTASAGSAPSAVVAPPPAPAPAPTPTPTPTTSTPQTYSSSRYVYCFGDPIWGGSSTDPGWWYDGTSTGWVRQASVSLSQRVVYDDSVTTMQSVTGSYGQPGTSGPCHTVKAEIQPNDYNPNQLPSNAQRATVYLSDDNATNSFFGSQPAISPQAGQAFWYGFNFTTNPGFVPHYDPVFGNWNGVFAWHDGNAGAPLAPIGLGIATLGPASGASEYTCGSSMVKLAQPRLEVDLTGGDLGNPDWASDGSNGTNTCRRYQGPVFQPGHLYHVQMSVKWDANQQGTLQVFIDGTKYVDVGGVSTMWRSGSTSDPATYPIFQNYRIYDAGLPVNDVYYGGLIKGSTQFDVTS